MRRPHSCFSQSFTLLAISQEMALFMRAPQINRFPSKNFCSELKSKSKFLGASLMDERCRPVVYLRPTFIPLAGLVLLFPVTGRGEKRMKTLCRVAAGGVSWQEGIVVP
mmetsp:Transcript_19798/g.52988  ORF Transcript_19798/g.52988 Transcript_19798/m.52988 type:complete len:109 (-) Transcript_19798:501-827(-)